VRIGGVANETIGSTMVSALESMVQALEEEVEEGMVDEVLME
jgi:hypothetical protein